MNYILERPMRRGMVLDHELQKTIWFGGGTFSKDVLSAGPRPDPEERCPDSGQLATELNGYTVSMTQASMNPSELKRLNFEVLMQDMGCSRF